MKAPQARPLGAAGPVAALAQRDRAGERLSAEAARSAGIRIDAAMALMEQHSHGAVTTRSGTTAVAAAATCRDTGAAVSGPIAVERCGGADAAAALAGNPAG